MYIIVFQSAYLFKHESVPQTYLKCSSSPSIREVEKGRLLELSVYPFLTDKCPHPISVLVRDVVWKRKVDSTWMTTTQVDFCPP